MMYEVVYLISNVFLWDYMMGAIGMNNKAFAFICCVNNERMFEECCYYIGRLIIPEGYSVEVLSIREADSISSAYNEAMRESDAKYKIYLHQDVFIYNTSFLSDILKCFENPKIGMLGILGKEELSDSARYEHLWDTGWCYACAPNLALTVSGKNRFGGRTVRTIDGMIMITQYDIEWNENLQGWHFYDIAHSEDFLSNDFEILVPKQEQPWVFHDCGFCSKVGYEEKREEFCELYFEKGYIYRNEDATSYFFLKDSFENAKKCVIEALEKGDYENAMDLNAKALKIYNEDTVLRYLKNFFSIMVDEIKNYGDTKILANGIQNEIERYREVAYLCRRIENKAQFSDYSDLIKMLMNKEITPEYIKMVNDTSCLYPDITWRRIMFVLANKLQ